MKNVIGIFIEIGTGKIDCYERDLEDAMLKDTAAYYSGKAAAWIPEDSCPDYMLKANLTIFVTVFTTRIHFPF